MARHWCSFYLGFAIAFLAFGAVVTAAELDRETMESLAAESTDAFQQGNQLLRTDPAAAQAQFEKATLRLERIIREGGIENGKLYYNLGNIWFQRGNIGRAILNYLRAEQYIPNDPNLQRNLAFVRQQRTDRFEQTERRKLLSTVFFWHYDLPSGLRVRLFTLAFVCFWTFAALRLFKKNSTIHALLGVSGVLALGLFLSLTLEARRHRNHPAGVVVAAESIARKGDGETYERSFEEPLHAGTEFRLIEDRGRWLQVALPDERRCWLPRTDVALVREKPGTPSGAAAE